MNELYCNKLVSSYEGIHPNTTLTLASVMNTSFIKLTVLEMSFHYYNQTYHRINSIISVDNLDSY